MKTVTELRREVARACHLLYERGFVANHEGNITCLTPDGHIIATPTAMSKMDVQEQDLLMLDRFGRKLSGTRKPFSEISMHLAVYRARPDVGAVVHAHPPFSTAFAVVGKAIEAFFLPEFVVSMGGKVPLVPFALPGSETLVKEMEPYLQDYDCLLLQNHGVIAYAGDIRTAVLRLEHCEEAAKVLFLARFLGEPIPIPEPLVHNLLDARTKAGLGPLGRALLKNSSTK
jgi:L-fuculose-phosphate aldolase